MRGLTLVAARLLAGATVLWIAAWAVLPWGTTFRLWTIDVGWTAVCWLASALLVGAALRPAARRLRTSFLLLAGGTFAWGAGQAVWTYHELVAKTDPFPSLADVGFLAVYPLFAAAVLAWPGGLASGAARDWAAPALAAVLALLGVFELMVEPLVDDPQGFAEWLALAYPALDALLIAALVLVLGSRRTAERSRAFVLALSLLALCGADALFQQYDAGGWITEVSNLGWTIAFAGAGAVAFPFRRAFVRDLQGIGIGIFISLLIAAVVLKEYAEDRRLDTWEGIDSLVFGLVVVAVVYLSWRAAGVLAHAQDAIAHEAKLRTATMEASRTGNCVFTVDGDAAFCNTAFHEILDIDREQPLDWDAVTAHLQRLARDGTPIPCEAGSSTRVWTHEGRFVEIRFEDIAGGELLLSVDDRTDREREAATRARFVAEIVGAQEAEARRIAGLLHDDAVQQLTALALQLELAAIKSGDYSLEHLAERASYVTTTLRSLLVQLHPAVLASQGLGAAIEAAASPLRAAHVTVEIPDYHERHPIELEQLAYRVVQEAFANALKHARATSVRVDIARHEGRLRVAVHDDGGGFDTAELGMALSRGRLGLQLVRERVQLAGGTVEITSGRRVGTRVAFALPLPPAEPAPATATATEDLAA